MLGLTLFVRGGTVLRRGRGPLRPSVHRFGTILAIGTPAGLQGLAYALSRLILLRVPTSHAGRNARGRGDASWMAGAGLCWPSPAAASW